MLLVASKFCLGWVRCPKVHAGIFLPLLMFASGCASSTGAKSGSAAGTASAPRYNQQSILEHEDVKGKAPSAVFNKPLTEVHQAEARALIAVGAEIKENEPYYLSGRRPNKVGLFVGSGGEKIELFLHPNGDTETQVWVDTDLSFVGIAGQQGWNEQVLGEMRRLLQP